MRYNFGKSQRQLMGIALAALALVVAAGCAENDPSSVPAGSESSSQTGAESLPTISMSDLPAGAQELVEDARLIKPELDARSAEYRAAVVGSVTPADLNVNAPSVTQVTWRLFEDVDDVRYQVAGNDDQYSVEMFAGSDVVAVFIPTADEATNPEFVSDMSRLSQEMAAYTSETGEEADVSAIMGTFQVGDVYGTSVEFPMSEEWAIGPPILLNGEGGWGWDDRVNNERYLATASHTILAKKYAVQD